MRIKRTIRSLLLLASMVLGSLASSNLSAGTLETEVDREKIIDGESIVLYITGTDLTSFPDTSALLARFRIIHSGEAFSNSIINGKRTAGFKIRLELQPLRTGAATIPAFTVDGVSSEPIVVEVVPQGTPGVEPRDRVFAEISVDNDSPYVQQQIVLSLKIFDDVGLASADPVLESNSDLQVEPLPLSGEVLEERDGVQYLVHTFRYAVFPQKSGELTVDSIRIPASIVDKHFGSNSLLRSTPMRRIELRTNPLTLNVKPRAPASTSGWWLPVRSLELNHKWSEDIQSAKAGEPLTLTFELLAVGSTSTQLPEIPMPNVPGLKIYADTPQLGSRPRQNDLVSLRREKWSVIPGKSGLITLPEFVIKWWDTTNDVERELVFEAQELQIAAGELSPDQTAVEPDPESVVEAKPAVTDVAQVEDDQLAIQATDSDAAARTSADGFGGHFLRSSETVPGLWRWLAIAAMLAWLLTLIAWWWSRRMKKPATRQQNTDDNRREDEYWKELNALSGSEDIKAYSGVVLQWAQSRWPEASVHNLPEIGVRLGSPQLTDSMRQLDQQRYSGQEYGNTASVRQIHELLKSALKKDRQRLQSLLSDALPQL